MSWKLATEDGLAFIEALVASLLFMLTIVPVAFLLSLPRSYIVAEGDERVAFYLAEQKLEQLRALGFAAVPIGGPPIATCTGPTCYHEALTAGVANAQTFTRRTTVDCVAKSDFTVAVACPNPPVLKRLTVAVTAPMLQADPVVLQTVLATP